jgi:RimJ/RimL family protein N-acetyltransferase
VAGLIARDGRLEATYDKRVDAQLRPGMLPALSALTDGVASVRPWTLDDLECIEEASADPEIPYGTTVPIHYSAEAGRAFIARQRGRFLSGEGVSLATTDAATDAPVGLMCLLHRQQSGVAGVGYWTVRSQRGRGLTKRSLVLLTRWALNETPVFRLEALVDPRNAPSIVVLEYAGFQREGTLRSYLENDEGKVDAAIYSLIREDL